ncbi:hypothetical protein ACET3X_002128 [Alternaria dauci]|uniref:SNF2 N-terminal domain-containing protein n=1 Tax=Alternaria dauci TaxID=48095 RepID=A0ABR3UNN9_9PLEO
MAKKAREVFGGSMNIDKMGLGKTRQVIDLVLTQDRHPNDAFNLVVTEKAVLTTWAREAAPSYTHGNQPRVMILDDSRTTFAELYEKHYDIVLVSFSAVMWQLKRLNDFKRYMHIWRHCGKEVADEVAREEGLPTERPIAPLFSTLLYLRPFRIVTKIIDEAHRIMKWDGRQRAAFQAMETLHVELVAGTPCGNVWTDNSKDLAYAYGRGIAAKWTYTRCGNGAVKC